MALRRFDGRVAMVTGAGQGIGRAIAHRIADEGGAVAVVDRATKPADDVAAELRDGGAEAEAIHADLSTLAGAEAATSAVLERFGRIDVLVNNVGGTVKIQPFVEYAEDDIVLEIERSFWPTMWTCRAVVPHLVAQGSGSIVNLGSSSPRGILRVPYAAAKGAVFALTTSLALEVATAGVRVNCVAPGATDVTDRATPRNPSGAAPTEQERAWRAELDVFLEHQIPMGRYGTVDEQASVVAFVASDDASFMTGQIFVVAGGATV